MPQKNRTVKGVLGGLAGLVGLSVIAGVLVAASVTPAIAMTGLAGSQALSLFDKLPSYLKVDAPMEQSHMYAMNGDVKVKLASFYEQNRVPVKYDQVAPALYDAILSSEDKNFYNHGGVNLGATVNALVDNIKGTSTRGASTISQQFVKNVLIQKCEQNVSSTDPEYDEKLQECWLSAVNAQGSDGIERKLQEMRYAIQIEKDYSKNDILLGYLNIANFGGTVYGIEAAASRYFNTTASALTVAQAATLAGMVQDPNRFRVDLPGGTYYSEKDDLWKNGEADGYAATADRRHYVLGRMLDDGKITQAQYDEADASPITPAVTNPTQGCAAAGSNAYFCQYVKTILESDPAFGAGPEDRRELLLRGGLEIMTTLDFSIQGPSSESMSELVPANYDDMHLGAAGVSVGTDGRVLAMTQNTLFSETPTSDQAYTGLVFASDKAHGGSIGFQVGSTYKLFTLIDWLEKGHSVNEVLNGRNRIFNKMHCGTNSVPFGTKVLGNFDKVGGYTGTVMSFTSASLNSGYLAMAEKLDVCEINEVADRMGVTLGNGGKVTDENVVYDVLGSKSISPLAMASAYATVANNGIYCTPRAIDKVIGQDGTELPLPKSECSQVLTPEVAATAAYALSGVMNGGTGARANPRDGVPVIGKTGTHETWSTMMIESSTKVATAVWVGRWEGQESIYRSWYNGTQLQDIRYSLARSMQAAANATYGGDRFPDPAQNLIRTVLTDLPNVVGMTLDQAEKTLEEAGFSSRVGAPVDSDQPTNVVAAQDPGAGRVAGGAEVTISPSNGQSATVPNVNGKSPSAAQVALAAAGYSNVSFANNCSEPGSVVESTSPGPGAANKSVSIRVKCETPAKG